MITLLDDLERQARALTPREKATLARILIEELDPSLDAEVEELWITEAHFRYEAFLNGELVKRHLAMMSWQERAAACNDWLSLPPSSRRRDDRSMSLNG